MKHVSEYHVLALCVLAFLLLDLFSGSASAGKGLDHVLMVLHDHLRLVALVQLAELISRSSKSD